MFRAMLWKEVREQAAILIALLVLGSGVIAVAAALGSSAGLDAGLGDFRAYTNAGRLAVLALTLAAGVVIGASLFAGEIENETMACLEMLPVRRWKIWWSKLAAGIVMAVVAGAILIAMGTLLGAFGSSSPQRRVWIVAGGILMFVAFAWGTFGSTFARSTLGACAAGLFGSVVFGVPIFAVAHGLLLFVTQYVWSEPSILWLQLEPVVAAYAVVLVPIAMGGLIFTAPDRARFLWKPKQDSRSEAIRPIVSEAPGRIRALFWLVRHQWFVASLIGIALALVGGLAALLEEMHLLIAWPMAASLCGVCGGVFAWTDEQSKDTFKYWGERRLPLNGPWLAKILASLAQTVGWTLLLFLPVFIRTAAGENRGPLFARAFGDGILGHDVGSILAYLLVWPLYGFAFGHLAGLLFRKTIVALGVGLLTAAPIAALWLPSLVTGGVHGWMLWPVPLLVLASTRLLLRPWSADRLATARPLATIGVVAVASIALIAFGLSWRFLEVPVTAEIDDDLKFAETVPQLDSDDGGRAFRQAVGSSLSRYLPESVVQSNNGRFEYDPNMGRVSRAHLNQLAHDRWPPGDLKGVGRWLERGDIRNTVQLLKEAARKPMGPIENPRVLVRTTVFREINDIQPTVHLLLAHGLWWQRKGDTEVIEERGLQIYRSDPERFVDCLEAALAVTRNARTMQPAFVHRIGMAAEVPIFDAVEIWLARAWDRPDLVRRVLDLLKDHERTCPRDPRDAFIADRMIDRNTLNTVSQWAPKELELHFGGIPTSASYSPAKQKAEIESELAGFAVVVPWERERFRRIMGVKNAGDTSREQYGRVNSWFGQYILYPRSYPLIDSVARSEAELRLSLAQVALALYALENGRPAAALDDLVPKYLAAVPVDPYDGKPLRFRRSEGEKIKLGSRPRSVDEPGAPTMPLEFEWPLHQPLAGFIGGLGFTDLPLPIAPGVWADGQQYVNLDSVGAVAGGLVQWPLEELQSVEDDTEPGGDFPVTRRRDLRMASGMRNIDWSVRWKVLVPGQSIVWSIGTDRTDNLGALPYGAFQNGESYEYPRGKGDFVRFVPVVGRK